MKKYFWLFSFFNVFCSNKKTEKCIDRGINIEYLIDINKLVVDAYKCDSVFNDFNINELKECKVLFSDSNYKVVYDGYKSRLLFDKKENITITISTRTPTFKEIEGVPFSLFLLNDKLLPIYAISKLGKDKTYVYKIVYLKNEIIVSKATNKESIEIDVKKLKYNEILNLLKKDIYKYTYKKEKQTLDIFYCDVPFWTEGLY